MNFALPLVAMSPLEKFLKQKENKNPKDNRISCPWVFLSEFGIICKKVTPSKEPEAKEISQFVIFSIVFILKAIKISPTSENKLTKIFAKTI